MRGFSVAFYMLLSILGLSFISLAGLVGVQYYRGKVSGRDLHSMLRVLGGASRIMIPNQEYEDFRNFVQDREKAQNDLERLRGGPETREPAARRIQEERDALRDNLEVVNRLLENEKKVVTDLRSEVEGQKRQLTDLIRSLDDERKKNAIVERDEITAKLRKTLSEMDAGDVAAFLSGIIRDPSQGGPTEAARIMRSHLKADYTAEVLGEMSLQERQRVIPLLENRYAGVPPDAVVKLFTDGKMGPGEIIEYLLQMNPQQALGVYLRLPPALQEQIAPQVLRL